MVNSTTTYPPLVNGVPSIAHENVIANGHIEYSNGETHSSNQAPASSPYIEEIADIELQLLALMKHRRGVISPVCKQRSPLARTDFHDEVAGCIYGAAAWATENLGTATRNDVLQTLESWTREETDNAPLAAQGLELWSAIPEPEIPQDDATTVAIELARQVKERGQVPTSSTQLSSKTKPKNRAKRVVGAGAENVGCFSLDDIGNGQRFAHEHGAELRFCSVWQKWAVYQNGKWQPDEHGIADERAKQTSLAVAMEAAQAADDDKRARLLKHAATLTKRAVRETMLKDASSVPNMSITPEQFDADLDLFNVANGTLYLPARDLRPHNPDDLLTHQSPVRFDAGAQCPIWRACMERWIPDEETRRYLQKLVGVSLSGRVFEELFVFLYGDGDNGKSTFLRVLEWLLGGYGHKTQAETIMQAKDKRKPEAPSPDVLALKGARLVTVHEIDSKHTLNATLIKDLTGRDRITARGLFEKRPTTFDPQFTLWMVGNSKPKIEDTSGGMWRRPRLIPFGQPIPASERDPHLGDKLAAEISGVLNWALDGLRDAYESGLESPEAVKKAVAEYRAEQDALADFVRDCCIVDANCTASAGELWSTWEQWSRENGEKTGTQRAFGTELKRRKFESYRGSTGNRWRGIGLLSIEEVPHQPHQPQ